MIRLSQTYYLVTANYCNLSAHLCIDTCIRLQDCLGDGANIKYSVYVCAMPRWINLIKFDVDESWKCGCQKVQDVDGKWSKLIRAR